MSSYRMFTIGFKRQVAQEYLGGASLNALSRKHEVARNLIRIWVAKYQTGELEPDFVPMLRLSAHEIKIAELKPMVGKLTMELEFLRGVSRSTPLQRGAITSIVSGPVGSPSRGMRAHEPGAVDLLQPAAGPAAGRCPNHREDRRDLRRISVLWLSACHRPTAARRHPGQPQEDDENHAVARSERAPMAALRGDHRATMVRSFPIWQRTPSLTAGTSYGSAI